MEEYLQYMKSLRTQINVVEDDTAKISMEEQMQIAIIHTIERDLNSATSETKLLKEDNNQLLQSKCDISCQIIDKQKRIVSLEYDSSTLSQTLALIQQERTYLSAKLVEKGTYYMKVAEEMKAKLQEQQVWLDSQKFKEKGNAGEDNLLRELDVAKSKLDEVTNAKFNIVSEINKMRQSVEQVKCQINGFKPELRAMNIMALEEEHEALSSDKGGLLEYLQGLQDQFGKMKGTSHAIDCVCGQKYKVELDAHL